jgi:beta-phosphoglucomutase family hydrolase
MVKAVIFDMDGVLVDSELFSFKAYERCLSRYGITLDHEDRMKATGSTLSEDIDTLSKKYNIQIDKRQCEKEKEETYRKIAKGNLRLFGGVKEFIALLRKNNIRIAVASSGVRDKVLFNLHEAGLDNVFDTVLTADDISHSKPHPEIFLKAAEKLKVEPSDCVVVEDSVLGVEAAKNAGMLCIAVTNTFPGEDISKADIIVSSLSQVDINTLKSLEGQ